jgi:DNA-binding winged helix-turn-helix (wHTH) protein
MARVGVRFGDCELSVERIELRRGGEIVDLEPQVFDVLAYLLRHRERVVPKTELFDQIWGNRFVSELGGHNVGTVRVDGAIWAWRR